MKQIKYRKSIRVKGYDYKKSGYYFVTICTSMRKPLLNRYKEDVLNILEKLPLRFPGVRIDFYSVLPDHLHIIFIFENAEISLGNVVRTFKSLVTKTTGYKPFWEWNYYEHIIRDEKALNNIRKYIEGNPFKEKIDWKIVYRGINATATK